MNYYIEKYNHLPNSATLHCINKKRKFWFDKTIISSFDGFYIKLCFDLLKTKTKILSYGFSELDIHNLAELQSNLLKNEIKSKTDNEKTAFLLDKGFNEVDYHADVDSLIDSVINDLKKTHPKSKLKIKEIEFLTIHCRLSDETIIRKLKTYKTLF